VKDKKELVRIVRSPEGIVSIDISGKKAGRGAYVCPNKECVEKAIKSKSLEKALNVNINEAIHKALLEGLAK